ncbi:MAG: EAL domain-containing protein [Leptospirillum sp.]
MLRMTGRKPPGQASSEIAKELPYIVGVVASAGGLSAFNEFLKGIPPDSGLAYIFLQHLDPSHESVLSEILQKGTSLKVVPVQVPVRVKPNHLYVITPGTSLLIRNGVLSPSDLTGEGGHHQHLFDQFLESLASDLKERAVGVILSGAGSDGSAGISAIKNHGGVTLAQDDTAIFPSMPTSAILTGSVDFILPPFPIAQKIVSLHQPAVGLENGGHFSEDALQAEKEEDSVVPDEYRKVVAFLKLRTGVDFSLYKSRPLLRRITRRMMLSDIRELPAYLSLLEKSDGEVAALFSDILLDVTAFFRNPHVFEKLSESVLPRLLGGRTGEMLRIWVVGCSSGEEAYSLSILLTEFCEEHSLPAHFQIFATDLNDDLLRIARAGVYESRSMEGVSLERRSRFFTREEGLYRVSGLIRDRIVFARHNILKDPPFSRMDLVSCRNLLIYLDPFVQNRVIRLFHYALSQKGCLLLGLSESVGASSVLFLPEDKKLKIYWKKNIKGGSSLPISPKSPGFEPIRKGSDGIADLLPAWKAEKEVARILIGEYAPPGVLVNGQMEIVHFLGAMADFLETPSGKPSLDLFSQMKRPLVPQIRQLLATAKSEQRTVTREGIALHLESGEVLLSLKVIPLKNLPSPYFLILFEKGGCQGDHRSLLPVKGRHDGSRSGSFTDEQASSRIAFLESELLETQDYLESLKEQHQSVIEELQATGEEVQSANEELQSTNEEIETSNAELESANEELQTINEELSERNAELLRVNNDLENLSVSINTAILVVARDLSLRSFTPMAGKLFSLSVVNGAKVLERIRNEVDFPEIESFVSQVIRDVLVAEREVFDHEGRVYLLRVRPYMTDDNRIDGAVLVFFDITTIKGHELEISRRQYEIETVFNTAPVGFAVLNSDFRIVMANQSFLKIFEASSGEILGRSIFDLESGAFSRGNLQELLLGSLSENSPIDSLKLTYICEKKGVRTLLVSGNRLDPDDDSPKRILLSVEDISEKNEAMELDRLNTDLDALVLSGTTLEGIMDLLSERMVAIYYPSCLCISRIDNDKPMDFHAVRGNNPFLVASFLKKNTGQKDDFIEWETIFFNPERDHRRFLVSELPKHSRYRKLLAHHGVLEIHGFPFSRKSQGRTLKGAILLGFDRAHSLSNTSVDRICHTIKRFLVLVDHFGEQETLHLQNTALNLVPNGVLITDPDRKILWVNKAMSELSGYSEHELVGQTPRILHSGKQDKEFYQLMWETIRSGRTFEGRIVDRRKDGSFYTVETVIIPMMDADGVVTHYVGVQKDVRDSLTGLLNRTSLNDRLHMEIERNLRINSSSVVFFLDIDGFKSINDTMGHEVGDCLLQEIGLRLSSVIRTSDFVARWGGDEFVLVMTDVVDISSVAPFAEKVLSIISNPVEIDGTVIHVTASVGIAIAPKDSVSVGDILKKSDIAMFQAKDHGKNTWKIFDLAMESEIREQYERELALKEGISAGQFRLFFQPQMNVLSDRLVGVEALVRWDHPTEGLMLPGRFIPLAERTGLIIPLGEWVLEEAFRTIDRWMKSGMPRIRVGVNVSASQFWHPPFWEALERHFEANPETAFWLDLELTESVLLKDPAEAANLILKMRMLGVRMTLDDFGTGYSSLSYLSELSLDAIKIPQEFVIPMHDSLPKTNLVKTIVQMAKILNLDMVGEGAETMEDVEMLSLFGCAVIQGFALSRPLPLADIEDFMRQREGKSSS